MTRQGSFNFLIYNVYMAIKPTCDTCGKELTEFGAIVLSPPDESSKVRKYHLCVDCFEKLALPK
ncbi:MAG: hypothetical protein JWO47_818 [Candidatus Saccharibacteria bacterium]|nr:hypothetical protein [Candidatus Saccharibacteria bacterium]